MEIMTKDDPKAKAIIKAVKERKDQYYQSDAYRFFNMQSLAVEDAVAQRYREGEKMTRSGFYLATLTAAYEALLDSFSDTYGRARPLFLCDPQKVGGEDLAQKQQNFLNRTWDKMGRDKTGGLPQWLKIARDVPLFTMGVGYTRWAKFNGIFERPQINKVGAWGSTLDFKPQFQVLLNGPEIERIDPRLWFGCWTQGDDLPWEGCIREYTYQDAAAMLMDQGYLQPAVQQLLKKLEKGNVGSDTATQNRQSGSGMREQNGIKKAVVYEYWGDLTNCKEYEGDPTEYCVICTDDLLLKFNPNYMFGYRPFFRARSSPLNDSPFGRSILAPNLPHTKIQNLIVNLGIDDVVTRMHNGWAVWSKYLKSIDDFANPEGADGLVYMTDDAPSDKIPRRIGGERSGILDDAMRINEVIGVDRQTSGFNNQSLGHKDGTTGDTATQARLLEASGNRRTVGAIIQMAITGLMPAGKRINMLAIRNTSEEERRSMSYDGKPFSVSNEDAIQIWDNNIVDIHESVVTNPAAEAANLAEFLTVAKDALLQVPDASHLMNLIGDIGRKKGLNVDRYLPKIGPGMPPQVGAPPGMPPQGMPPGAMPPEMPQEMTEEAPVEMA